MNKTNNKLGNKATEAYFRLREDAEARDNLVREDPEQALRLISIFNDAELAQMYVDQYEGSEDRSRSAEFLKREFDLAGIITEYRIQNRSEKPVCNLIPEDMHPWSKSLSARGHKTGRGNDLCTSIDSLIGSDRVPEKSPYNDGKRRNKYSPGCADKMYTGGHDNIMEDIHKVREDNL